MANDAFQIMIVDENRRLCEELSAPLIAAGCRVECLVDGSSSYRSILERLPSLLILDISLPDPAGLETLRRLHNHRSSRKLPIIVISNQAEFEFELLDVFDFLKKPVDLHRLLEDIRYLRDRQRADIIFSGLNEEELTLFQEYLIKHSGLYFDRRNSKILERGLQRRMRAVGADTYTDYFDYLNLYQDSRTELKKLIGLLTVGETSFFRYSSHRDALVKHVIPELIRERQHERTLRFWSAGCSTGEEPYSVAIFLLEHFPQLADWKIEILATDINKRSLRRAREAIYNPRAVRLMGEDYIDKYFHCESNLYLLDRRVRDMVEFKYLNLQVDEFPSPTNGTSDVDCILCCNVMIYFRIDTIREIVARISRCLRPDGFLFLGHAETMQNISDRFVRLNKHNAFFYQRRARQTTTAAPLTPLPRPLISTPVPARHKPSATRPPRPLPTAPKPPAAKPFSVAQVFSEAEQAFHQEDYRTASQKYDTILAKQPDHSGALLGKIIILANEGNFKQAAEICERVLQTDDLCAPAYFLRGLIHDMEDDLAAAITEYKRAIWLDMQFIAPHYYLSKVLLRQGNHAAAERELRNSIRLLEKSTEEAVIPYSGGLSRSVFLEICRADTEAARTKLATSGR
ncbi:MAG: CheR family methyltransferase [Desulfuromonadales bacterium]|nr:CheR family methyltransferase [Desulfuromonadales bacterium]